MITTKESHAGAMACIKAIQDIERIMGSLRVNSRAGYEEKCADSEQAMIKAAEPNLSPFMVGFVTVFAEYMSVMGSGSVPILEKWEPFSAMTEAEATAKKNEIWKEEEENNVISLCAFRNK